MSCLCGGNAAILDRFLEGKIPSGSTPFGPEGIETDSAPRSGDPYLVAEFPTGAEIYLISPQPDAAVATPWVDVTGTAPSETVITLNDEIAVAGSDGRFSARVPLETGLNEILCSASDSEGNEVAFSILVAYEPGAE
jgi:hypothetical protein